MHQRAVELALQCLTDRQIAKVLGVTPQTIHNWKKNHPQFKTDLLAAKAEVDDYVESALFKRATGATVVEEQVVVVGGETQVVAKHKQLPPDTAAAFIWLKNRRPKDWKDKKEITGLDGEPITIRVIPGAGS
jgi:Putative ATPase subunit of terminase (gpP-like).